MIAVILGLLAHGGTGGLVVELSVLVLPLLGVALLWWWNRRQAEGGEPGGADEPTEEAEP